jgi:predicted nucleic acid-binding protein
LTLVLDSSATLAWIHGDERTSSIEALFDRVLEGSAVVPGLWRLEVANSLNVAIRRKRISQTFRDEALEDPAHLDIIIDSETDRHAWQATIRLADLYGLTVYDAAYLELAQRLRLPLATLDKALADAALIAGIEVLPRAG